MKYKVNLSGRFRRDCKRHGYLLENNKLKEPLQTALDLLERGEMLPPRFSDHKLSGKLKGTREFHVEYDLVCVYRIEKKKLIIEALMLGTHKEAFDIRSSEEY